MKSLILSDIHANITALNQVLEDAGDFDSVWVLGDLVGYGPDPNACIERVRNLPGLICLLGNHDAAITGFVQDIAFNPAARQAIQWTRAHIATDSLEYLHGLPESTHFEEISFAHGSPREPVWEYLLDTRNATENFQYFDTPYCLVGHTHLPTIYLLNSNDHVARLTAPKAGDIFQLEPRAIINPGSVGQPRDHDPRASYAILDRDEMTIEFRRTPYDVQAVQMRMRQAGLPERHMRRLAEGW